MRENLRRIMSRMAAPACCAAVAALALVGGCLGADGPATSDPGVAIAVAPLKLPGVTEATYRVTVTNADDDTVWTRSDLSSTAFGDGAGGLSYVGPCDPSANPNTVALELLDLRDAAGALPAASWQNPTPISQDIDCAENGDVPVDFDLTVMRAATQGFFDVAVSFQDLFCSAKLS